MHVDAVIVYIGIVTPVHYSSQIGPYIFRTYSISERGGLAIRSADICREYTRLSLFTGGIESESESDSTLANQPLSFHSLPQMTNVQ